MNKPSLSCFVSDKATIEAALSAHFDHLIIEDSKVSIRSFYDDFSVSDFKKIKELADFARNLAQTTCKLVARNRPLSLSFNLDLLAHEADFTTIDSCLLVVKEAQIPVVRVQDPGLIAYVKEKIPGVHVHFNQEIGNQNKRSIAEYFRHVSRQTLSLELPQDEIKDVIDFCQGAQSAPESAKAAPGSAQADPESAQAAPGSAQADPESAQAAPGSAQADPESAQATPGSAQDAPESAQAHPGNVHTTLKDTQVGLKDPHAGPKNTHAGPFFELQVQGPIMIQYSYRRFLAEHDFFRDRDSETISVAATDHEYPGRDFHFYDNPHGHFMYLYFDRCLGGYADELVDLNLDCWMIDHRNRSLEYLIAAGNFYFSISDRDKHTAIQSPSKGSDERGPGTRDFGLGGSNSGEPDAGESGPRESGLGGSNAGGSDAEGPDAERSDAGRPDMPLADHQKELANQRPHRDELYEALKKSSPVPLRGGFFRANKTDQDRNWQAGFKDDPHFLGTIIDIEKPNALLFECFRSVSLPMTFIFKTPENKEKTIQIKEAKTLDGSSVRSFEKGNMYVLKWHKGIVRKTKIFLSHLA